GGGHLGPDLSGLGASAAVDYIIEAIRTPSKAIRENYEGLAITTKDWEYFTGVKLRETRQELVLRDSIHDEITIRKEDIEESKDIGSLMPVGLINTQTHAEFLDLVRFISELGKPGDFATQNAPVVRRWRMKVAVKDGAEPVWVPAYSLVSGDLPLKLGPDPVVLQFELEVTTPGEIAVRFDDAAGLALQVNEAPVAIDAGPGRASVHLERGRARFQIEVDASRRAARTLRAELLDLEGSAGRAQIISGI
ncbi:MAG: hypothetical protein HYV26_18775, partial [Candidatus Hydrogenedentes bacterium]|nr:hypothetical protein [Candidatus Hydrogenedentota bacterium]